MDQILPKKPWKHEISSAKCQGPLLSRGFKVARHGFNPSTANSPAPSFITASWRSWIASSAASSALERFPQGISPAKSSRRLGRPAGRFQSEAARWRKRPTKPPGNHWISTALRLLLPTFWGVESSGNHLGCPYSQKSCAQIPSIPTTWGLRPLTSRKAWHNNW